MAREPLAGDGKPLAAGPHAVAEKGEIGLHQRGVNTTCVQQIANLCEQDMVPELNQQLNNHQQCKQPGGAHSTWQGNQRLEQDQPRRHHPLPQT